MLRIEFEGWFQCRFATDPDPSDDPRGVSGPTFVVPGEPPFDRVIRLQDPVCPRYPREEDHGVFVRRVLADGAELPDHPLLGGKVELLGDPSFAQRNLVLVEEPFLVYIDPFDLRISAGGIVLRRAALWDVTRPELRIEDVFLEPELLKPRTNTAVVQSAEVAEATGFLDYDEVRRQRKEDLIGILERTTDPVRRAALEKRIRTIDQDRILVGMYLAATQFLGMQASFAYPLNGTPEVSDPQGRLGGRVGTSQPWPLEFWLGGYDVDSLFGYMRGALSVPFRPTPAPPPPSPGAPAAAAS